MLGLLEGLSKKITLYFHKHKGKNITHFNHQRNICDGLCNIPLSLIIYFPLQSNLKFGFVRGTTFTALRKSARVKSFSAYDSQGSKHLAKMQFVVNKRKEKIAGVPGEKP